MKARRKIYSASHLVSAVVMILALAWLTVSTPFVLASQQEQAKQQKMEKSTSSPIENNEEESSKPLGSNTEEKVPNANSLSEEYLHTFHTISHFYTEVSQYHKHENSDIYIAFHGELLVPPPNAA
jgi:flagellar biosynthesis/type III secretory pathway M-ring protein FliF/YscJ